MKNPDIGSLRELGCFSEFDDRFALAACRLSKVTDPLAMLGAAVASRFTLEGHVCADLRQLFGKPVAPGGEDGASAACGLSWPGEKEWLDALRKAAPLVGDGFAGTPLVLDSAGRLYLKRYYDFEAGIAARLREMVECPDSQVDGKLLSAGLERMFPADGGSEEQKIAAMTAVLKRFAVLSGGPGTGKTSTVVKILALLAEQAAAANAPPPRVLLVAPTGKAKARLEESIRKAKTDTGPGALRCAPEIVAAIPDEASTVHRAVGSRPGRPSSSRHHAGNPLPVDVLVCDEASMVDVAMMARLLDATPRQAKVVLLGDRDQLASVEAGAVLAEICEAGAGEGISKGFAETAKRVAAVKLKASRPGSGGIGDCAAFLTRSFRFAGDRGIGRLAAAVNAGDHEKALEALSAGGEVELCDSSKPAVFRKRLRGLVVEAFGRAYAAKDPAERLSLFNSFRVLCAHREGERGAAGVNELAEEALASACGIDPAREWYEGRPLMITANDYQAGLFNGDLGMIGGSRTGGGLKAFFVDPGGKEREIWPGRLPPHETVFAMTVHKSQGSEFDSVAVVLPERPSPVVTRELLYTALTRAKKKVWLFADPEALRQACAVRLRRSSGLLDALLGDKTLEDRAEILKL